MNNSVENQVALLRAQIRTAVNDANAGMPAERQVPLRTAAVVVQRSFENTTDLPFEVREFNALRDLSAFITLAQRNKSISSTPKNTDLLPVCHPASTAPHAMTASALRQAKAQWILSDTRISEDALPILASAFEAEPHSLKHTYAMARLNGLPKGSIPLSALTAAFGDGNSTLARRARAMLQKRDSKGRFAYQGGGISALIKRINGIVERLTGHTVSSSPDGKTVRVELPNGKLVDVNVDSGEFIKAIINPTADGFSGVPAQYSVGDKIMDEASLKYYDAPHGFNKDESYTGAGTMYTDDSYNVVKNEDGTFSITQRGTGVDLGTEKSWSDVQKTLQKDDENLAKAEGSQPIARLTEDQINDMYDSSKNPLDVKSPLEIQDTVAEEVAPAKGAPDGFEYSYPDGSYKLSPRQEAWLPEGNDGQESTDYTDDPKLIANKWKAESLVTLLERAVLPRKEGENATGYGAIPYNAGPEQVPAEAIYDAIELKGLDSKMELAKIYDKGLGTTENQDALTAAREEAKTVVPEEVTPEDVTPEKPSKGKKEAKLPKPDVEDLPLTTGQKIAWFLEAFSSKGKGLIEGLLLTPKPTNQMIYEYVKETGVPEDELRQALEDAGIEIEEDSTNEPNPEDIVDAISSGDLTEDEITAMMDGEGVDNIEDVEGEAPPEVKSKKAAEEIKAVIPSEPVTPEAPALGEPEPLPVAPPNVKNGDISPGGDWVWIGKDATDPTKDVKDKGAHWDLTPQGKEKQAAGATYSVDTSNTPIPQWLQDATPEGWTPKIYRTWDWKKGFEDEPWIEKTLEDGTLIRLAVNADGTYTIKNGFGYSNAANVHINEKIHATPASAEEVVKKSINQTRGADRSNLAAVLKENKFDQATIDAVLNSPAEEAKKAVLESDRYKEMQAQVEENAKDAPFAASNQIANYNQFKNKVAGITSATDKISDSIAVDESKIDIISPQSKPEVLTPTAAPVAMTEKVGDPVKVKTSVSELQAGDVLANDFFTVESVYSDSESEAKKPGSVWVTGYYPGHASQKTKLWNPSDSREVYRNVDVPAKGDLPELSKPFAKDYDPEGKVFKDTALDLFVPKDAEARSKYLDAVDQYNAKLAEAMGKWTAPVDAPSQDATATDPNAPHKISVAASDIKAGDIAFRTENPDYSGGALKEPYTNYFVVQEVFTDENTPAGKVNVRGYYPGHTSQVREWNKDTPIDVIRGEKVLPAQGENPELVLKKQKDYPVDPVTKKMTTETRAEWLKNVEDFHAAAKASAVNYSDPVGDYTGGANAPEAATPSAPKKPGRAPSQPAFQGDRLVEISKEANGDPQKFMELLAQEEIAFFDYETVGDGGFGPDSAPIQLAAHKIKDGEIVDSFDMFINPGKPLGEYYYTTDENGNKVLKGSLKNPDGEPVTDEWLATQPTLEEAHKAFVEWLGEGAILGGQNIAGFDVPILKYQLDKAGLEYTAAGIVDTLPLAQSITKAPPHSKGVNTLEALAARYGISLDNAHNAAEDSKATHGVLFAMLDELAKTKDADALTHLDPESKFAEYEGKFADWQAAREAYKAWTAAQALKEAEAKIAQGEPVSVDELIKSASAPEVPNPDGIFNTNKDAINPPTDFPTGPALKDSPEWVKDDNNTTLIEDTLRPTDFKVGDFIPAEFGGFYEILSIEQDPNKDKFFNITTRVVGTDKVYVKNWFKHNKNYNGVRRPNNALDGSEMPVLESPADAPLPMPEAPAKWNNYDVKQNEHGNFYADGISAEDAVKLRTGELQPPALPFFVPMYGNTDPNSGEGDLYTEQSIAEGGPRKYWGQFGGAGVLLRRKNADGNYEYLLARRQGTSAGSGKWAYFGGAHDTAEAAANPEETVLKELGEEAGIDLTGKVNFNYTHDSTGDPDWSYKTLVGDVGPDAIGAEDIKTNWEHSEHGWFTADQIKDMADKGALFGPFANNAEAILNLSAEDSTTPNTGAPVEALQSDAVNSLGTVYDVSNWTKIGEAGGSTGGGVYQDQNGNTFFVKPPNNVDDTSDPERHARNEALASALYEEAGVKSGRIFLGKDEKGNTVLVSPWVDGSTSDFKDKMKDPAVLAKAQEAFAVDAWLMNWDSVGLVYDNMIMNNGDVVRIDPGGSLLYRARGKSKQEQMSDKVTELDTLRSGTNIQANKVFGSITDAQLAESAKLVQAISPERINQIVDAAFPDDKETADFLKQKLIARRQDLIDRFNLSEPVVAPSQPSAVAPSVEEVTPEAPSSPSIPKADISYKELPLIPEFGYPMFDVTGTKDALRAFLQEYYAEDDSPGKSEYIEKDISQAEDAGSGKYTLSGLDFVDSNKPQEIVDKITSDNPPTPPSEPTPSGGGDGPEIHHLDPAGDMAQQIADAIDAGKLVAFKYHEKERLVTPHGVWENPQNGNVNFSATDAEGVKKNYTLSKIEKSDNAPESSVAPKSEAKPSLISNYPAPESVVSDMATDVDPKTQDNFDALKKNIEQLFDGVTVEVSDNKIVVIDNDTAGYIALVRNSDGSLSEVGTAGVYEMDPQIVDTHSDYVDAEDAVMEIVEKEFDVKGTGQKVDQTPESEVTPSNASEVIAMGEAMKDIYPNDTVLVDDEYFRVTTPEGDMVTVISQGDGTFDVIAFGADDENALDPIDIGSYNNLGDATNALHDAMTALHSNNFRDNPIPVPELLIGSEEDNDSPIGDIVNDAMDGTTTDVPSADEIINEVKAEKAQKTITDPNLILESLKKSHPDHYTLDNGDLVVRSKNVNGDTYETVVRRNPNETFSVYLRETNGTTGVIREVHFVAARHSDLAVNNLIAKRNNTLDKFADPKKWFTSKKATTPKVTSTEAPQNTIESAVQDVVKPEFPMTGDLMTDGLLKVIEAAANEPGGIQKVLDGLQNFPGISKETYDNLMVIVNTTLAKQTANAPAKGEAPDAHPWISMDGTPLQLGDTVVWVKRSKKTGEVLKTVTGTVHKLLKEQVTKHENGEYGHSDYIWIKIPGNPDLQKAVSKNVKILSSAPDAEAVDGPLDTADLEKPILPPSKTTTSGPTGLKPKPMGPETPANPDLEKMLTKDMSIEDISTELDNAFKKAKTDAKVELTTSDNGTKVIKVDTPQDDHFNIVKYSNGVISYEFKNPSADSTASYTGQPNDSMFTLVESMLEDILQAIPVNTPETPEAPLGKIYLDPAGDMKAQIQDAIDNQREISFVYNGKERSFIPEAVFTHEGTGNDLLHGVDDGKVKNFNLANIEKSADFQPYTPSPEKPKTEATPDEVKTVDPATVVSGEATLVTPDSVSPLGSFAYFNVDGKEILVPNSLEGVNNFWSNQEKSNKAISDINPGESIVTQNPQGLVLDYELSTVLKKEVVGDNTVLTVVKLKYLLNGDNNTTNHEQRTITLPSNSSLSVLTPKNGGNGGGGTLPEPDPINPSDGPATVQETADILSGLSDAIKNDSAMSGVNTDALDQAVDAAIKFDEGQNAPQVVTDAPDVSQLPLNEESLDTLNKYIEDFVVEPGLTTAADIKPGQVVILASGNTIYVTSVKQNENFSSQLDIKGINLKNGNEFSNDWSKTTTFTLKSHKDAVGPDPYGHIPLVTLAETKIKKNFTNIKKLNFGSLQVGDIVVKKTGPHGFSYQILAIPPKQGRGGWNDVIYRVIAHNPDASVNGKVKKDSWASSGFSYNGFNNVKRPSTAWLEAGKNKSGFQEPVVTPTVTKKAQVVGKVQTFNSVDELTADAVGKQDFAFFDAFGATTYNDSYADDAVSFKDGATGLLVKDSGGSGSGKNMVPGMVVTDANGNAGILTNTYKASDHENSTVDVTWLSGPDAGTSQTGLKAFDVTSAEKFINYDKAAEFGVDINPEIMDKIKAKTAVVAAQKAQAIAEKKAKEEAKAAWEKLKKDNQVKGSGADPVVVEGPVDWSSSDFSDIPTLASVVDSVQKDMKKASVGVQVLADSDQIEDNKIRIYRVKDKNGNWQTRVRFKLTDWAGVAKVEDLLKEGASGSSRLQFRKFEKQSDGSIKSVGHHGSSDIDKYSSGTTFSLPIKDAQGNLIGEVLLHRAVKDASTLDYLMSAHSSGKPLSYNNEVDIYLPDGASIQQIEDALKTSGVSQARPATKEDIKILAENKIIALFGDKADGANNFKGELRAKVLQDMKDKYGLDASQIKPEVINNGDITFVMPDDVAEKLAQQTGATYINHNWTGSSMPSTGKARAEFLFELLTGDGLRATVERWAAGINSSGMSSDTDGYAVGANYVFTSKNSSPGGYFSFDGKKLLRRLDFYANKKDSYGQKKEKDILEEISAGYVYEILFKGTISWADLAKVHVDSQTRDILIELLNKANIKDFGGKTLEEIFGG